MRVGQPELIALAASVDAALRDAGWAIDDKPLRAHLTLARIRQPQDATRWLSILDTFPPVTWQAADIALMESHLGEGPNGHPRYESIATCPLGPPKAP